MVTQSDSSILSKKYYQFVDNFTKTEFENNKLLGKYYTDYSIAESMVQQILDSFQCGGRQIIRVIDPFCGDGRLVKLLLFAMNNLAIYHGKVVELTLWDIDPLAVKFAEQDVKSIIDKLEFSVSVEVKLRDAFIKCFDLEEKYDICITNPPWALLKPQKKFNERCSQKEKEDYIKAISVYDDYIKSSFPLSQPIKKFGRWGTNLARTGVEVALKLIKKDGMCGIVSPASLFNDQVSIPLRQWIFEMFNIRFISYYSAKMRLYGAADVSSITMVLGKGKTRAPLKIKYYTTMEQHEYKTFTQKEINYIKRHQYAIPFSASYDTLRLLQQVENMPTVQDYCDSNGLFFTRELDETRVMEKLCDSGDISFIKGYMVDRFSYVTNGLYLDENVFSPPESVKKWKIVWRDISRNSQIRRMKATILKPGCIAGNSLGVICARNNEMTDALVCLLGIMNSMVFETQARCLMVSNHVSSGMVKTIHIPVNAVNTELVRLVDKKIQGEDVEADIEVFVARLYGMTDAQILKMLSDYKLDNKLVLEIENILNDTNYREEKVV